VIGVRRTALYHLRSQGNLMERDENLKVIEDLLFALALSSKYSWRSFGDADMISTKKKSTLVGETLDLYGRFPSELFLYSVVLLISTSVALLLDLKFVFAPANVLLYTVPLTIALLLVLPLGYVAYRRSHSVPEPDGQLRKPANKQILE
jgi:hypothetical protein